MTDDRSKSFDAGTGEVRSVYCPHTHPAIAEKLYALGVTQSYVAEAFGVSLEESSQWESDHPEFHDACQRGRSAAAHELEHALHKRATGYVRNRERLTKIHGVPVTMNEQSHIPPSVSAIRLLLNRGKTVRDATGDEARNFKKIGKPETTFDIIAENEKKQIKAVPSDE
jgi:transcriptional regulator with XRE-family HTH domain